MAEIASAFVTIAPSAKGFGSSLNKQVSPGVTGAGKSIGRAFGKMFVLGAGVIAAAGIGSFLKGSVDEAREAQKVGAQTGAVLKSTGGAANVTAKQIGKLASSLSAKNGVDDEAIQAGENMLLTFTKVRNETGKGNDVFNQATRTVQDMAAAFGGDAVSNSKILGKALNDPVKGVSALTKVGVSFTDKQKEQIKTLVESGDTMGAQKVILGELAKETKGSAAAQVTAADKARVAFGNIKETIGTALLPIIDKLASGFVALQPAIQSGLARLGPFLSSVGRALKPVVETLISVLFPIAKKVFNFLANHRKVLALIAGGLLFLVAPVSAVAIGLAVLYNRSKTVRDIFAQVSAFVTGTLVPALGRLAGWVQANLFPIFTQIGTIIRTQLIPTLTSLAQFFIAKVVPVLKDVAQSVAHDLKPTLDQLVTTVQTKVLPGVSKLLAKFEQARPTIQRVAEVVLKAWAALIKLQAGTAGKVLPVLIRFVAFLVGKYFSALGTVIGALVSTGKHVIDLGQKFVDAIQKVAQFAGAVKQKVGAVVNTVKGVPGKIKSALGNAGKILYDAGKAIIQGLIDGITAKFGDLKNKLGEVGKFIKDHKGPPAKDKLMLVGAGKLIMDGLIAGIESREKKLTDALDGVTEKISKKVKEQAAKIRDSLVSVRSDFASLVEPIASNFTQGLFDFDTAGAFTANLTTVKGTLTTLLGNFKTLIAEGLNPGFLYQLFQSGGPGLINSLAGLDKASAVAAGALFSDVTSLSNQLGGAVSGATDKGAALENQTMRLEAKLDKLIKHVDKSADRTGDRVNGAAAAGHRRGR